jgi:hypothetical protein
MGFVFLNWNGVYGCPVVSVNLVFLKRNGLCDWPPQRGLMLGSREGSRRRTLYR